MRALGVVAAFALAAIVLAAPSCGSSEDHRSAAESGADAGSGAGQAGGLAGGAGGAAAPGGAGATAGGAGATGGSGTGAGGGSSGCSEQHPSWTIGLRACAPGCFDGYTLFAPSSYQTTYLIDIHGRLIRSWPSAHAPGMTAFVLEDGHLLRAGRTNNPAFAPGGRGGILEEFDWDGNLVWTYTYSTPQHCQHHDIRPLPNGHVVMIAWEKRTQAEAIQAGRNPAWVPAGGLWADTLVEVAPTGPTTGDVVWLWRSWDHLVQDLDPTKDNYVSDVADYPGRLDINYPPIPNLMDWLHVNGIDYDAALDQLVISARRPSELYVVDHATATAHPGEPAAAIAAAAGPAGDLLYRWGNPQAYGRGTSGDQVLYALHGSNWIEVGLPGAGDLLVFNNGEGRPGADYSSVEQLTPPLNASGHYDLLPASPYGPPATSWHYQAPTPTDLYASSGSSAQRLPNGNTLVCASDDGQIFEVTAAGEMVWNYLSPVGALGPLPQGTVGAIRHVFRAHRYAPDYPGLAGRDLTPGDYIEQP